MLPLHTCFLFKPDFPTLAPPPLTHNLFSLPLFSAFNLSIWRVRTLFSLSLPLSPLCVRVCVCVCLCACDVFHDVTYMMVIYDCSLKEAHQYKIALRQPAMWVLYLYIHMSFCVCVCVCMFVCVCVCVYASVYVCVRERERVNICVKTMAQRRKNASFSASSATKRCLTNIARASSTKTARPHKEPL